MHTSTNQSASKKSTKRNSACLSRAYTTITSILYQTRLHKGWKYENYLFSGEHVTRSPDFLRHGALFLSGGAGRGRVRYSLFFNLMQIIK